MTIVIPVHNLIKRGLERVYFSILSLSLQTYKPKIIIADSSGRPQYDKLNAMLKGFDVIHARFFDTEFNKPILLNKGIRLAETEYVMCTDADYLFSPDFCQNLIDHADINSLLLHRVVMLPKQKITHQKVKDWSFQKGDFAPHGKEANGGCQFATRRWFDYCGGYDERMKGWCGMDNDMVNRARLAGMKIKWIDEGEILHQYHPQEKLRKGPDIEQSKKNWKIRDNEDTIIRNN